MYLDKQAQDVQELLHWVFRLTVVALAMSVGRAGQMAASGNYFRSLILILDCVCVKAQRERQL